MAATLYFHFTATRPHPIPSQTGSIATATIPTTTTPLPQELAARLRLDARRRAATHALVLRGEEFEGDGGEHGQTVVQAHVES